MYVCMHVCLNRHLRLIPEKFSEEQLREFFVKRRGLDKEEDELSQMEEEKPKEYEVEGKFLRTSLVCFDETLN